MKVEKINEAACTAELNVSIDAEEMAGFRKDALAAICAKVSLPGFRKGKVPRSIVEQRFADSVTGETMELAVRKTAVDAAKEAGIDTAKIYAIPEVKDTSYKAGEGMIYTVTVETAPSVEVPDLAALKIEKKDVEPTPEEIDSVVAVYRDNAARYEDAKEGETAADGDYASIDYSGTVDGKPISEIAPDAKAVDSAKGFWVALREGSFLPEIIEALKGMKPGEEKKVEVKFPEGDPAPEGLAGATAEYSVKMDTLRKKILPGDEEFFAHLGVKSMEEVRDSAASGIRRRKETEDARRREDAAVEFITKGVSFDLPPSLVRAERNRYLEELRGRAQQSGLPADYFEKNRDEIMAQAEEAALNKTRLSLVLLKVAKDRGLNPEESEVAAEVGMIARSANLPPEEVMKRLEANGRIKIVLDNILSRKAMKSILDQATA